MSTEIFPKRHLSVFPLLDPHPPAASGRLKHRELRHQEGSRERRPVLHILPMTQLAQLGEHRSRSWERRIS